MNIPGDKKIILNIEGQNSQRNIISLNDEISIQVYQKNIDILNLSRDYIIKLKCCFRSNELFFYSTVNNREVMINQTKDYLNLNKAIKNELDLLGFEKDTDIYRRILDHINFDIYNEIDFYENRKSIEIRNEFLQKIYNKINETVENILNIETRICSAVFNFYKK
tara:strand:+ start:46007 stop:46501 length:495 start_codon:yes stop_codon:yes gene_type:complete